MSRIFTGVPLPTTTFRKGPSARYPTEELGVGQSFYEEPKEGETFEAAVKRMASSSVRVSKKFPGRKFRARVDLHPETGAKVVGVWRIA